jgi:hypothetical protein
MRRAFGLNIATGYRFASHLATGSGEPDLEFRCTVAPALTRQGVRAVRILGPGATSHDRPAGVEVRLSDSFDTLHFGRTAEFDLSDSSVTCHLIDPAQGYMVEILLLGTVFAFWFERQGLTVLHASAVSIGDRAVGFMGRNGAGKSSVGAGVMREGFPLLSDDLLALHWMDRRVVARPGYPQMRMWPDQAIHFLGDYENLGIVHPAFAKRRVPVGEGGFGAFEDRPRPLACLYVLQRRDPHAHGLDVQILAIPPVETVTELVRHSFIARIAEALGWQANRLSILCRIAEQVPVRRVSYPAGFRHLPDVCKAILEDAGKL